MPRPLLALLVLAWLVVMLGFQCVEGQGTWFAVVLTASLCIAGWANHVRLGAIQQLRDFGAWLLRVLFDLLFLFLLSMVCGMVLSVFMPTYQCYGARAKVSEAMVSTGPLRDEITQRAEKAGSLVDAGVNLKLPQTKRISGGMVSANGQITVFVEEAPAMFSFIPEMKSGVVEWRCEGFPAKQVPLLCRVPQ